MPAVKGGVRRSQLITTYGVGSIVPVEDEAFMVAGLHRWNVGEPDLHEPRLERLLNTTGFCSPPASGDDAHPDVPVVRFPIWHSCPGCRTLARHWDFTQFDRNVCPDCDQPLVPSRFVVACESGHIDDFPYLRWVHKGRPPEGAQHELKIEAAGTTASLAGIQITCSCGAERTMEGAFDRFALRDVTRCTGRRPWLDRQPEVCELLPRTLQRGASSVWFGFTRSALSIPPWSESASRALDRHWAILRFITEETALRAALEGTRLPEKTGYSLDDLMSVIHDRRAREQGSEAVSERTIRREEYEAMRRGRTEEVDAADFATKPAVLSEVLRPWFEQVQLVTRLREVRVLAGFSRIVPPRPRGEGENGGSNLASLSNQAENWLPAMEVKGEGIFLRLDLDAVERWEANNDVEERARRIRRRDEERHEKWGIAPERQINARLLLVHVLAHALINQLSLDAGYPAASLRERLYVDGGLCGLLVYTATSDSAGSLGGIVSHGEGPELEKLVLEAIARYSWCSADPVCIESESQGVDSLNLAACHACALLPETSCEEMNGFLDRAMLVGTPELPEIGFFNSLLTS